MYIKKKQSKLVSIQLLGCDECKEPIGSIKMRVSYQQAEKGIHGKKQWGTKWSSTLCPKCYRKKYKLLRKEAKR